jgi:hypothetical protein
LLVATETDEATVLVVDDEERVAPGVGCPAPCHLLAGAGPNGDCRPKPADRWARPRNSTAMPHRVETDPEGVDYGWVMQVTFVATIVLGAPLVAALSLGATLPTWNDRLLFAVRVGAFLWLATAVVVYAYARWYRAPSREHRAVDPD